jgi:DNA (cytosine-5)-methyltransferase 1
MKYGSVCSGVEAATAAWHPLGWEPQWFSEIEKFPSAVLAHHYPDVPNLGDMTQFKEWPIDRSIDLLVGGTPCQSFSVAGLRKGLDDPRGNLMLTYLAIAAQYQPKWLVWENVPGVLSSQRGRDFGTFLGALGQLGYGFAYRVLDAQYFGVAQRRRRVFVVGYLGDWRRAAAVLFERESMSGHPAPSREAGQKAAPTVTQGAPFSRTGNQRVEAEAIVAQCLTTRTNSAYDPTTETLPIAFGAQNSAHQGDSVSTEVTPTLDKSKTPAVCAPLNTQLGLRGADTSNSSREGVGIGKDGDPSFTLQAAHSHAVITPAAVRRLTPIECERLQGFPDDFTQIPWRNKPTEDCPDGPRYKAMGNSMAVPVMRWIGERIQMVESLDD